MAPEKHEGTPKTPKISLIENLLLSECQQERENDQRSDTPPLSFSSCSFVDRIFYAIGNENKR